MSLRSGSSRFSSLSVANLPSFHPLTSVILFDISILEIYSIAIANDDRCKLAKYSV